MVLLIQQWMGLSMTRIYVWRCWDCLSLINWIGSLTLYLFLKLKPLFVSWSFSILRLLFMHINLPSRLAQNIIVISELILLKLQERIYRALGPTFAASHEPFVHYLNESKFSLFCRYYLRTWTDWAGSTSLFSWKIHSLFWQSFSWFLSRQTGSPWSSLLTECFPVTKKFFWEN